MSLVPRGLHMNLCAVPVPSVDTWQISCCRVEDMFNDSLGLYIGHGPLWFSIFFTLSAWLLWTVVGAYIDYRVS